MPQLRPREGRGTVTPAALPAAAPRPAEHPRRGWWGGGFWVSLRGRQAEPVIGDGDDGKATLAGGSAGARGARWTRRPLSATPLLWPLSLLLRRGPAALGAAEPIGAREAVNNQPRSISATSRASSPTVAGPPRSPPAAPGTRVPVPLLRRCRLPPWGPPSGPASVLGAETRAPSAGGGRGAGWVAHRCALGL